MVILVFIQLFKEKKIKHWIIKSIYTGAQRTYSISSNLVITYNEKEYIIYICTHIYVWITVVYQKSVRYCKSNTLPFKKSTYVGICLLK